MIAWGGGALSAAKRSFCDALTLEMTSRGHDDVRVAEVYPDVAGEGQYGAEFQCGSLRWSTFVFVPDGDLNWTATAAAVLDRSPLTGRPMNHERESGSTKMSD